MSSGANGMAPVNVDGSGPKASNGDSNGTTPHGGNGASSSEGATDRPGWRELGADSSAGTSSDGESSDDTDSGPPDTAMYQPLDCVGWSTHRHPLVLSSTIFCATHHPPQTPPPTGQATPLRAHTPPRLFVSFKRCMSPTASSNAGPVRVVRANAAESCKLCQCRRAHPHCLLTAGGHHRR